MSLLQREISTMPPTLKETISRYDRFMGNWFKTDLMSTKSASRFAPTHIALSSLASCLPSIRSHSYNSR